MLEQWKDIPGWEDLYQASNLGRVRSKDRMMYVNVFGKTPCRRLKKGRVLKQAIHNPGRHPEYLVSLSRDGKKITPYVHRLIALTFIPNPQNLPEVNHKDENSLNNCVWNLEWCTRDYNLNYSTHNIRVALSNRFNNRCKPVLQYNSDMVLIREYHSTHEASRITGIKQSQIWACVSGKSKTAHGYVWRYKEEI